MIISLISHGSQYDVTPHLNHLIEMVQMRGHNICFYAELTKNYPKLSPKLLETLKDNRNYLGIIIKMCLTQATCGVSPYMWQE